MSESQDLREWIRGQSLLERKRAEQAIAEIHRQTEAMHRHFDRQDRKLNDLLAEAKAQREALFLMMDRLDSGGGAAPA